MTDEYYEPDGDRPGEYSRALEPASRRSALSAFGVPQGATIATNLPKDAEHAHLWIAAKSMATRQASEYLDKPFRLKYYLAHRVPRVDDKTGEEYMGTRTVLIDEKGESIVCSGPAVMEAVATLVQIFGNESFPDTLTVRIRAVKGSSGHSYHVLLMDPVQVPSKKGKV